MGIGVAIGLIKKAMIPIMLPVGEFFRITRAGDSRVTRAGDVRITR